MAVYSKGFTAGDPKMAHGPPDAYTSSITTKAITYLHAYILTSRNDLPCTYHSAPAVTRPPRVLSPVNIRGPSLIPIAHCCSCSLWADTYLPLPCRNIAYQESTPTAGAHECLATDRGSWRPDQEAQ